jgi:hypothetical protein
MVHNWGHSKDRGLQPTQHESYNGGGKSLRVHQPLITDCTPTVLETPVHVYAECFAARNTRMLNAMIARKNTSLELLCSTPTVAF